MTDNDDTNVWENDTTGAFEWWTRQDLTVGAMRSRNQDGTWDAWTIAYVEDGYPASDDNEYTDFPSLEDAQRAAVQWDRNKATP